MSPTCLSWILTIKSERGYCFTPLSGLPFPAPRITNPNETVYLSMLQEHTLSLILLCTNIRRKSLSIMFLIYNLLSS